MSAKLLPREHMINSNFQSRSGRGDRYALGPNRGGFETPFIVWALTIGAILISISVTRGIYTPLTDTITLPHPFV